MQCCFGTQLGLKTPIKTYEKTTEYSLFLIVSLWREGVYSQGELQTGDVCCSSLLKGAVPGLGQQPSRGKMTARQGRISSPSGALGPCIDRYTSLGQLHLRLGRKIGPGAALGSSNPIQGPVENFVKLHRSLKRRMRLHSLLSKAMK